MTPEHTFELLKTIAAVVPATVISVWALISQRRQVKPRLEVLLSPIFWKTIDGKPALGDDWPGIVVRNQSAFPLRVCNVGLKIDKKYYQFGKPLLNRDSQLQESEWPYEVAPRARAAFYVNYGTDDGRRFTKDIPSKAKDRLTWEAARGYAITECGREFVSKKLSRQSLQMLHAQTSQKPEKVAGQKE
ncbi:MAG: hypothetical protein LAN59_16595 [Acidobacteriia bacterium]|nr:hypothetical protein [Terriglobia bacterium]